MHLNLTQLNNIRQLTKDMYLDKIKNKDVNFETKYKTLKNHPVFFWVYEMINENDLVPQGKKPKIRLVMDTYDVHEMYIRGKVSEKDRNNLIESLIRKDLHDSLNK